MKQVWSVGRVASWTGFCLPCGRDDRPLVLTRSGAAGLRAWVAGIGDDDRTLLLTCRVCGEWQVVPLREEDDPPVRVEAEAVVALASAPITVPAHAARRGAAPAPAGAAPGPAVVRLPLQRTRVSGRTAALPSLAPLPLRVVPTSAALPPDEAAVAAARSVLSAARAGSGQQRTTAARLSTRPSTRSASQARRRRNRRGPTPRRPDSAARTSRPTDVPVAEATSIVLPLELLTSGHSVLLAAG